MSAQQAFAADLEALAVKYGQWLNDNEFITVPSVHRGRKPAHG